MLREEWLNKMSTELLKIIEKNGYDVNKKIRISCGLPSRRAFGAKQKTIGQCWNKNLSADQTYEIFISPTIDDSIQVSETLIHELIHAVVGIDKGHGSEFKKCAMASGLTGKMTATTGTQELKTYIEEKIIFMGEYPHRKIDYNQIKRQSTRLVKVFCGNENCLHFISENRPYIARVSSRTIDYGLPRCGCCDTIMQKDQKK
jgi:hypothetical protein